MYYRFLSQVYFNSARTCSTINERGRLRIDCRNLPKEHRGGMVRFSSHDIVAYIATVHFFINVYEFRAFIRN